MDLLSVVARDNGDIKSLTEQSRAQSKHLAWLFHLQSEFVSCFSSGINGFVKFFFVYFIEPFFAYLRWKKKISTRWQNHWQNCHWQTLQSQHSLRLSETRFVNWVMSVRPTNVARGGGRKPRLMTYASFKSLYTSWIGTTSPLQTSPCWLRWLMLSSSVLPTCYSKRGFNLQGSSGKGFPFIFLLHI